MIPISVCIIAKNEEEYIEECLRRFKPYGFELIVVDTGSEDNTKNIATGYADKIYDFAWCNDFSRARNFAASKAGNDWILSVDCDEHLQKIEMDKLLKMIDENPCKCGTVKIISPTSMEQNAPAISTDIVRFYNRQYFEYNSPIHEQLVGKDGSIAGIFCAPIELYHYGYAFEGKKKEEKQQRNIKMLKTQLEKEPQNPYLYWQLGRSYRMLGNYEEALKYIEKGITLPFDYNLIYGKLLVVDYAQTLLDLGNYEKALRIEMLEDVLGDFADYVFELGKVYYYNKKPVKALQQYIKIMGLEEGVMKGTTTYWAYYMLMKVYHEIGETQMEETFKQKYLESRPKVQ